MYFHPSSPCEVPFVGSALKSMMSISEAYLPVQDSQDYVSAFRRYTISIYSICLSPHQKKPCNCSTCTQSSLPWSYFRLREALKSVAEVALLKQNCVSDDVIREWRKIRVCVIFCGLDFGDCVCVWSRGCDNEPCPCHHTLCSLRGGALQWKSCKESLRFNYPFHFYSYLLTYSGVFTDFGILMFSHDRVGCCAGLCFIVHFSVVSSLEVC